MEKFKVKVTNASEVLEIENILSKIGLVACDYGGFSYPKYIANNIDGDFSDYTMFDSGIDEFKLLTINELKDMVVLMQNNPKDANVYQDGDIPCLYDLYLTESKELYFYHCGKKAWILSNLNHNKDYYELLKPIKEEAMKEYLFKYNDQYTLVELSKEDAGSNPEQYIEIPEGSIKATFCNGYLIFWKDDFLSLSVKNGDTDFTFNEDDDYGFVEYMDINDDALVVWQRESLNDKIATAEVARQEEKHSHYKKDVSHLNVIDVYRVLELYGVESHAVGHAIKKLLCCGQRGAKGRKQDIQEAIDSLNRELEMVIEDEL